MGQCKSAPKTADAAENNEGGDPDATTEDPDAEAEDATEKKGKKKKKKKLTKAQKEVDTVLTHLQVPSRAVTKFLTFFKKMDDDESGSVSLEEFITFLELEKFYVPFIERCFGAMDFNKKGKSAGALDPTEFTVGLYNLCIMTKDLLEDYVFELYDEVHDGNLYPKQVEKMVVETSAHAPEAAEALVEGVFEALDTDDDGHISKKEFFQLQGKAEMLLRPMYLMQTTLQKRCLGESFWDEERVRMQKMLKKFEERTILDLLANRVAAKYEAERQKEALLRGENKEEEAKAMKAAKVKGFGSEKKLTGVGGVTFANDGGAPIFASDMKAKQAETDKKRKIKLKAKKEERRKKKIEELVANGKEIPEKLKKKTKKKDTGPRVSISVRGANKPNAGSSYAMKHKEELAVNQAGRVFD